MCAILHFINYALNLIYPNVCGICNKLCDEDICPKCELKLKNIAKVKIDKYHDRTFGKHLYIFQYEGIIKSKLIDYKFNEKVYIYKAFVKFMLKNKKVCRFLKSYDIIIPVPIHKNRKLKRGYNQTSLIAKKIAENFGNLQYIDDVLIKKIDNKPQSTKNKTDRKKDVIGVYELQNAEKLKNKKILILDDIYTTGSTLNECCKILKQANIKFVDVITIAKD